MKCVDQFNADVVISRPSTFDKDNVLLTMRKCFLKRAMFALQRSLQDGLAEAVI